MEKCPYYAEEIRDVAIVCRYCDRDLPGSSNQEKNFLKEVLRRKINDKEKYLTERCHFWDSNYDVMRRAVGG